MAKWQCRKIKVIPMCRSRDTVLGIVQEKETSGEGGGVAFFEGQQVVRSSASLSI